MRARHTNSALTTLAATGAAAGVTSTSGLHGSLGLDVALGGAGSGLVDSLDGNVGLVLTIFVVAYYLEKAVVSDYVAIFRVGSLVSAIDTSQMRKVGRAHISMSTS